MAEAIKSSTGVEAEMIEGRGGIFDVVVDGERIYCKQETGVFPTDEEILEKLAD